MPNLTRLIFLESISSHVNRVSPSHPEKLIYFECRDFNYPEFTNLEHLICRVIHDDVDPKNYPKLKRLEYYPIRDNQTFRRIESLKEHRKTFNPHLEISVSGFKLSSEFWDWQVFFEYKNFDECLFALDESDLAFLARNFLKLVGSFPWKISVNYSKLAYFFGGQIPESFFDIFPHISSVTLDRSPPNPKELDVNKSIDFLNKCRGLETLSLNYCELGPDNSKLT